MAAAALLGAAPAHAFTITDSATPLGIVASAVKPNCASPYAPYDQADLVSAAMSAEGDSGDEERAAGLDQLSFAGLGFDLVPTATLCTPDSAELPAPFSGTLANRLRHSRVGRGWREIGGDLAQPAPMLPGDQLTVPDSGDTAQLRVGVAAGSGSPAATVAFTDLSPGPSKVTVARDQRGTVATLTRSDGTTADAVAQIPVVPAVNPSISGTSKRWKLVTHQAPGTVVYASDFETDDDGIGVSAADGRTVTTIRYGRASRYSHSLLVVALNRSAMTLDMFGCGVRVSRKSRRPTAVACDSLSLADLLHASTERSVTRPPAQRTLAISLSGSRTARAARVTTAPLAARPVTRSPAAVRAAVEGLVPLAADVNGDGQPDFWSEARSASSYLTAFSPSAGTVLISSPSGLQPHAVLFGQQTSLDDGDQFDSEISAIDDVTGDGIGELIVDLGERQALIPGSRSWTEGVGAITAPDPAALDAADYLLLPSSSNPGAPYAALDDVTGDGRRELAATDDFGAWQSIASSALQPGTTTRLASVARAVPAPSIVNRSRLAENTAPRFDPRGRVIGGQFIALSWPTLATSKAPQGKVTISVHDALGRDVVAPASTTLDGNALLLDHDRRSGDSLLLGVSPGCASRSYRERRKRCTQRVVRVRADGSVRQTLALSKSVAATTAPQTARFLPDGPDADGDVEIVLSQDGLTASVVDSTLAGTVPGKSLPTTYDTLLRHRAQWYGLRFYPVVAPDGSRRVYVMLGTASRGEASANAGMPTELVWK